MPCPIVTSPLSSRSTRATRLFALALTTLVTFPALGHREHATTAAAATARAVAAGEAAAPGDARPPLRLFTGRVDTLTVIDRTAGVAYRYPRLQLADGTRVQVEGVALPADGAYVNVTGRLAQRTLAAEFVQSATEPASMARAAVNRGRREGTLRVFHVDYPDGTAEYGYALRTDDGHGNVVSFGRPPASIDNGMRAVISGPVNERGFVSVDTIEIIAPPVADKPALQAAGTPMAATTGYTVMPLKYPSNTGAPWTYNADPASWSVAAINNAVFGDGTGSAADYYEEVSYGAQLLAGVVAHAGNAWLLATESRPAACTSETQLDAVLASIESQGKAAATAAGFNPAARPGQLYVVDALPCGWAGLGYIGYPLAYTKGTASLIVVGHELGHNFGLYHAGSIDCGAAVLASSGCGVSEYGDPFGVMGNQRAMHFNAAQKSILGYIAGSGVATHAGGTTTYTLNPIELPGQARYAVKVPTGSPSRTYWIEFRQPIGFDSGLASFPHLGAQIRLAYPFENQCSGCTGTYDDTQFLDMTPATGAFTDGALLAGQSFTDTQHGVTISVVAANSSSLDVQVSTGGGGGGGPAATTTAITSNANPATQGQPITFTSSVAGTAPTGTVSFRNGGTDLPACAGVALSGSGNTRTATCTTSSLGLGSHSISVQYGGDAGNASSQSAALTQLVKAADTPIPTRVTLRTSANPAPATGSITLTATVEASPAVTGGTVQFVSNGSTIPGCANVAVYTGGASRTAQCVAPLAAGSFTLVAHYKGSGLFQPSSSLPLAQVKSLPGIGNTVQFAAATYGVNENAPSVTVTVTRIGDVTSAAVVSYATAPGTATSAEFQATSGTLTWAAQDSTPRTITIPILDEVGAEPDETFTVSLSAPSGTVLGPIATTTITVIDNESAPVVMPATATLVQNPYGVPNVIGATRVGNDLSGFTRSVDIELGTQAGAVGSFARIDFQGLSIGPGNTLRIRSGAVGQTVHLVNVSAASADIGGSIVAIGGNGAPPPVLVVQSAPGIVLASSGRVASPSGLTMSALYADITTGNALVNQGTIEGGPTLALKAARVNGGGLFRGNAITFVTFGNLNNPVNGAHYIANGLQLHPASGNALAVTIAGYGTAPQVYNLMLNGNGTLSMPSTWPAGAGLPPNNRPVLPNEVRASGVPDPAFGGGQIIVQAAGTLTLDGGPSRDFVFPGGFVLKSNGALDLKGTVLANGWTTSGTIYQGIFLEAPSIIDSTGAALAVFTNDLNWVNLAVRPALPVQTSTLGRQGNGTAQYGGANHLAPHLNFYALVTEAGAAGLCYICLVNTTVMDFTTLP